MTRFAREREGAKADCTNGIISVQLSARTRSKGRGAKDSDRIAGDVCHFDSCKSNTKQWLAVAKRGRGMYASWGRAGPNNLIAIQ